MKKNIIFLILFFLTGCISETITTTKIPCPSVFFAAEHNKYIASNIQPISVDELSYRAELNNYSFISDCSIKDGMVQADLSILFIITPYLVEVSKVSLPFYVGILNEGNTLIDMQYYRVEGNLKTDSESEQYIEKELKTTIAIKVSSQNYKPNTENSIVVGFMLDKEKLDILN